MIGKIRGEIMKPTIAILTDNLKGHGGEETVLQLFSDYLSDTYNLELVVPIFAGNSDWFDVFKNKNLSVYYNVNNSKLRKYLFVAKLITLTKANILICMTPKLTYFASKIRKIFNKKFKIVSWQHFSLFRPTDESSLADKKKWYGSADYYLAISSGIKKELISLGIEADKIFTIYNPIIPTDRIISKSDSEQHHFLCVARIQFEQQKNLKELFDACRNLTGNWVLDIYGNDDTAGNVELKKCQDYLNEIGLSDHVIWHGWVKNVWDEDIRPSCLVMTSNFEGFPMSLCEAASHGIPLISANCSTGPDDIVNEQNGFLYPMHDIKQLTSLMQRFIDNSVTFNPRDVQKSIGKFYVTNYIQTVKNAVTKIIGVNNEE